MFTTLKNHPFAVEAFLETSLVLTFAVPKEEVEYLIPECLSLDTFNNKWAFIAVAMVQTKDLRPKSFPKFLGNDFFLTGYRIFARYINNKGKRLRGLYILKSETDKRKMQFFGNLFTHYNYTTTDITQKKDDHQLEISSEHSGLHILVDTQNAEQTLPPHSPFNDWATARKFSGPLPFTFTYDSKTKEVLIIEGVRQNWIPQPVKVCSYDISFLNDLHLKDAVLANAFIIHNIPYYWKKGKIEQWKKEENSRVF
jgi:uncharacterized protein YqjF (DUF2071 family)